MKINISHVWDSNNTMVLEVADSYDDFNGFYFIEPCMELEDFTEFRISRCDYYPAKKSWEQPFCNNLKVVNATCIENVNGATPYVLLVKPHFTEWMKYKEYEANMSELYNDEDFVDYSMKGPNDDRPEDYESDMLFTVRGNIDHIRDLVKELPKRYPDLRYIEEDILMRLSDISTTLNKLGI